MGQPPVPPGFDLNKAAERAITEYFSSKEFKDEAKSQYMAQITTLVENAEKKARNWQVALTLLVTGIIFVLVFSELLNVREKRLSIDEEYVKVLTTAEDLHKTINDIRMDTVRVKEEVDSKNKSIGATLDSLEKRTKDLETEVNRIAARADRKTKESQ
jgi:hypothetical protein